MSLLALDDGIARGSTSSTEALRLPRQVEHQLVTRRTTAGLESAYSFSRIFCFPGPQSGLQQFVLTTTVLTATDACAADPLMDA